MLAHKSDFINEKWSDYREVVLELNMIPVSLGSDSRYIKP